MNNKIYVTPDVYFIDNFLEESFIDDLHDKISDDSSLWYRHSCRGFDVDKNFYFYTPLEHDEYSEVYDHFSNILKGNKISRIYVNGQVGVEHGNFHTDDGDETFLLGLTKGWNFESGGATEFEWGDDYTFSIYPKYNRMMCFPSHIEHRALPNVDLYTFRMTLAIKTTKVKNVNTSNINFIV
jgi:hypothetical protein